MSRLQELAVKHPYYCSESNYYSNDAALRYATMSDFLDEFEGADIDYNLCFRWDVFAPDEDEDRDCYSAMVFIMQQRKGKFTPVTIREFAESDTERFDAYISKHFEHIIELWSPLAVK